MAAVRNLDIVRPDKNLFPVYTPELREICVGKPSCSSLMFARNRPLTELLTARYSFVNGFASLYGLPNIQERRFVKWRYAETHEPESWGMPVC